MATSRAVSNPKADQHSFDILLAAYNDTFYKIRSASTVADKKRFATAYGHYFQEYVSRKYDINRTSDDMEYLAGTPIWFASLCMMEIALDGVASFPQRLKAFAPIWDDLKTLTLECPMVHDRALTGLACFYEHWATAAQVSEFDPNIQKSKVSVYFDCIVSTSQPKRIALAIEVMEKLLALDENVDRPSNQNGITALMRAAAYTNIEQCQWLLDHGAAINLRDIANQATALMHALDRKFGLGDFSTRKRIKPTLDFLIERGADLSLKPLTGEDFGKLVINCKALKGEDREYYKELSKNLRKSIAKPKAKALEVFSLEGKVTPEEIRALDRQTDFLLYPYPQLFTRLITFLESKGIVRFSLTDIATLVSPKWHGIKDTGRNFSIKNVEKQLNGLISGAKREINLTRDPESGYFVLLSDSQEDNVVAHQYDA